MKTNIIIFMLICLLALSSCNTETPPADTEPGITTTAAESTTPATTVIEARTPTTNDELFEYIMLKWKQSQAAELYEYANSELSTLLNEADFAYEQVHAAWNLAHNPRAKTVYLPSDPTYAHLSSTLAREKLQKGESLSDIIAPNALEWIMKYKETKDESQNSQT